ncbi:MAG: HAD family hydrolase [Anaerolineae bacterium]
MQGNRKRLVLFDVDGTLLHSGGAGREAIRLTLEAVYGKAGPVNGFPLAGKTDLQIFYELLHEAGFSEEEIEAGIPRAVEVYPGCLRQLIGNHQVRVCPGVTELLESLTGTPEAEVALLTGNLESGAWVKLQAARLDRFFRWGAFGSEARDRSDLPALAVARAHERTGHRFAGKEVVIVGDTPADILCGRGLGVRSIAVATGPYSCEDLLAWEPDFCFRDLTDAEAVMKAIFA